MLDGNPRFVFESEDELMNAKLFGGRSIIDRIDEILTYEEGDD